MTDPLGDLLSGDPHRIWQAAWEVIATRDTVLLERVRESLPAVRAATAEVELGGLIRRNRDALAHALTKAAEYRSWRCWCDDYPRLLQYDPSREEERGHVRILARDGTGWPGTYECVCAVCGRRFDVEEGEHHALWWRWRPEDRVGAGRRRRGPSS